MIFSFRPSYMNKMNFQTLKNKNLFIHFEPDFKQNSFLSVLNVS